MDFLINFGAIVGLCSAVCKVLELGARMTPTKKDDIAVGKIRKVVNITQKLLSYPALNPKK